MRHCWEFGIGVVLLALLVCLGATCVEADAQTDPCQQAAASPLAESVRVPATVVNDCLKDGKEVVLRRVTITGGPIRLDTISVVPWEELQKWQLHSLVWFEQWMRDRERGWSPGAPPDAYRVRQHNISIVDSTIEEIHGASAPHVWIYGVLNLKGTIIVGAADFSGVLFRSTPSFRGTQFGGQANFERSFFANGADFQSAAFGGPGVFTYARFGRGGDGVSSRLNFDDAKVNTQVTFERAVFDSPASFERLVSRGGAIGFVGVRFHADVTFGRADFGSVDFSGTHFNGAAGFRRASFAEGGTFDHARFHRSADFGRSTLTAKSSFAEAVFGEDFPYAMWTLAGTYDFAGSDVFKSARVLKDAHLNVHALLATVIAGLACGGALVCWRLRRRPLLRLRPGLLLVEPADESWQDRRFAGPHSLFRGRALLIVAYSILLIVFAYYYQSSFGVVMNARVVQGVVLAFLVWLGVVLPVSYISLGYRDAARHRTYVRSRRVAARRANLAEPQLSSEFALATHLPREADHLALAFANRLDTGVVGIAGGRGLGKSATARFVVETVRGQEDEESEAPAAVTSDSRPIWKAALTLARNVGTFLLDLVRTVGRRPDGGEAVTLARHDLEEGGSRQRTIAFSTSIGQADDELAFATNLFRRLCREVQDALPRWLFFAKGRGLPEGLPSGPAGERLIGAARELGVFPPLLYVGLVVASVAAIGSVLIQIWPTLGRSGTGADYVPWSLLFLFDAVIVVWLTHCIRQVSVRQQSMLGNEGGQLLLRTEEEIRRLQFARELNKEDEASVSLPKLTVRQKQSTKLVERALTLPEVVQALEDYVKLVRKVYSGGVIIHLDQIDKTHGADSVLEQLARMRAVLAIPGALYLVAVPDDILRVYRTRFREGPSEVDSRFDALVEVRPCTVEQGVDLLQRRTFVDRSAPRRAHLIDALVIAIASGGGAREIVRLAHTALNLRSSSTEMTAPRLLEHFWNDFFEGAVASLRRLTTTSPTTLDIVSMIAAYPRQRDLVSWSDYAAKVEARLRDSAKVEGPSRDAVVTDEALASVRQIMAELQWIDVAIARVRGATNLIDEVTTEICAGRRVSHDQWRALDEVRQTFLSDGRLCVPVAC